MHFADYLRINALKHRNKIALIERYPAKQQRRVLTWKGFNSEVNKIANYLKKELGVNRGGPRIAPTE